MIVLKFVSSLPPSGPRSNDRDPLFGSISVPYGMEVQDLLVEPKFAVAELQVQPAYHVSLASFTAPM